MLAHSSVRRVIFIEASNVLKWPFHGDRLGQVFFTAFSTSVEDRWTENGSLSGQRKRATENCVHLVVSDLKKAISHEEKPHRSNAGSL